MTFSRVLFAAIVTFWLVMNYLLWRSQWGSHSRIGSAIPVQVVWDKILTAPDNSSLEIYDHEKKIGICHWLVSAGLSASVENKRLSDDYAPDEPPPEISSYTLTFEGNTSWAGTNRLRFEAEVRLATNQTWQDFHLTLRLRPTILDLRAIAASQKLLVKVDDSGAIWQKTFSFSDLSHPQSLLDQVIGADALSPLTAAGLPIQPNTLVELAQGMRWDSHEDWMQFGHSRVRVYRLETQLLGMRLYLFISRAGEILWAEGPNKITFRNEAFSHF